MARQRVSDTARRHGRRWKVTARLERKILRLADEGTPIAAIARRCKLSRPTVYNVLASPRAPAATGASGTDPLELDDPAEVAGVPEELPAARAVECAPAPGIPAGRPGPSAAGQPAGSPDSPVATSEATIGFRAVATAERATASPPGDPPATTAPLTIVGDEWTDIGQAALRAARAAGLAARGCAPDDARAASAALWFGYDTASPAAQATLRAYAESGRPHIRIDREFHRARDVARWVVGHGIRTLHITGSPAAHERNLAEWAEQFVRSVFRELGAESRAGGFRGLGG